MELEWARGRKVLLLQGPNGPFLQRVALDLLDAGAQVLKVNLNAADWLFYSASPAVSYRGDLDTWPLFLRQFVLAHGIEVVAYFGQGRPYHRKAQEVLDEMGIVSLVFEEGYLRPDHLTVEWGGVNRRSPIKPDWLDAFRDELIEPEVRPVHYGFEASVVWTILNSLAVTLGKPWFPLYQHHRDVQTLRQAGLWARGYWRRFRRSRAERSLAPRLAGDLGKKYFFFPLQVHNDSQVTESKYGEMREVIGEVLASFARSAPPEAALVIKHHPSDAAYRDYKDFLREEAGRLGVTERVHYVFDIPVPLLVRHALGTVLLNTTVGWSSLHHGTPVCALGESPYRALGLCFDGPMDAFWRAPGAVDRELYARARRLLLQTCQANGSIWARIAGTGRGGIGWPPFVGRALALSCKIEGR